MRHGPGGLGVMVVVAALALRGPAAGAQEQSWRDAAAHLGTTARVLIVGTRPEDEDNALIAWLSLGRNVETAYLSLTRGESGENLIGAERQAPLAVVRTAELLAERQRDGAHQYFTRAYDFGSTAVDSIVGASWPRDSLLKDIVSVVRAFRPQIVISMLGAADEHDATCRLTARLVAESFSAAADTVRWPAATASRLPAWTVSRLYTLVDTSTAAATDSSAGPSSHPSPDLARRLISVDVGEFDRRTGESYAEIGASIRQAQRSQPAAAAPRVGSMQRLLRLDSSRVIGDLSSGALFGTSDTTMARFDTGVPLEARAELDTLRSAIDELRATARSVSADSAAMRLARLAARTSVVRLALPCGDVAGVSVCPGELGDLATSLNRIHESATRAMLAAAGLVIDGTVARQLVATGDSVPVVVTAYNGGASPLELHRLAASAGNVLSMLVRDSTVTLPPNSAERWSANLHVLSSTYHWWQINGLVPGTMIHDFLTTPQHPAVPELIEGEDRIIASRIEATVALGGVDVPVIVRPLVYRGASALRGDLRYPLAGVPPTSVLLERTAEYERAGLPMDRLFRVYVWSARSTDDTIAVTLRPPTGLRADSATRTVALPPLGARNVFFRLRGMLRAGPDTIFASARSVAAVPSSGAVQRRGPPPEFNLGIVTHEYSHIPSQQFVRFSRDRLEAVDVRVPAALHVAYVKGSADVQTPLGQLQVKVQMLEPSLLSVVDLSGFTTVLIGPDALANDALAGVVPALLDFMRGGGTIVVLPGRDEIARSGLLPYPITFGGAPDRVSDAAAAVRVIEPKSRVLSWPNVIRPEDFDDWIGERARDVPSAFDPRYQAPLSTGDPGRAPTVATLLTARVGKGMIVYTSLSIDEQLAAANPGAARLMVNLLAAGLAPAKAK